MSYLTYLTYLIPLYGGCPDYLLSALQVLQNRAARLATKSNWAHPPLGCSFRVAYCVEQTIVFQSVMLFFKAKQSTKPAYLYDQISAKFNVNTRLGTNNGIRETRRLKSTLARKSFVPRTIGQWNRLPASIRNTSKIGKFREKLKSWVKENFWDNLFNTSTAFSLVFYYI